MSGPEADRLQAALLAELADGGHLIEEWCPAFAAARRHEFIPDTVWAQEDGRPRLLSRAESPSEWLRACYTDQPVAVQLDDGDESGRGYVSSSASMPSIVADMLTALDAEPGMRVLEIGTGTGWNAALLAARLGAEHLTTIEVDPGLAEQARDALKRTGFGGVTVVTGDGAAGHPEQAPYDRVLSTAAVQRVPIAWVKQARPGGRIITPWGTAFHNGTLAHLTVHQDGTASGHFGGDVGFMWMREQRTPHGAVEDRIRPEHHFTETTTDLHPFHVLADFDASFTIGVRVPAVKSTLVYDGDIPGNTSYTVYLMAPDSGSWASWRITPDTTGRYRVRQHGPRQLFAELAAAYEWWETAGRPSHDRFGLTATSRDQQQIWLDQPENVIGEPPPVPLLDPSQPRSG
ncbi:methyltransferase domain-containing protein [Marinitenerispora sediminis]|uniref:methyltransferase domain-containing protein n=1 Tax=Marinitenerispora sediminis TaxID=1931232 RepID=UPI001F34CA79|nr:methyltransferase domain-containing protein [Marinitenerispora sediminis]